MKGRQTYPERKVYKRNYSIHKIKDIKGPKELTEKDLEIIEDLNEIHEIKDLKNSE